MMPGFDGEDLIGMLRMYADPQPVIVVTALADTDRLERIREEPFVRQVLSKPVTRDE